MAQQLLDSPPLTVLTGRMGRHSWQPFFHGVVEGRSSGRSSRAPGPLNLSFPEAEATCVSDVAVAECPFSEGGGGEICTTKLGWDSTKSPVSTSYSDLTTGLTTYQRPGKRKNVQLIWAGLKAGTANWGPLPRSIWASGFKSWLHRFI